MLSGIWGQFSYEKTKTSKFRDLLVSSHVSLSIPGGRTNRDVVEEIAKASHIPIESLPDELNQPVDPGSQVIWGFAGNEFDKIADNYNNMQWWVSDVGLNMAIVNPASPNPRIPTFDELVGGLYAELAEARKRPRRGNTNATVQRIKKRVRELRKQGLDYREICERLGTTERPPRATWRDRPWPVAHKHHTSAVTKWLSEACAE
jgi:hypothetical protein